MGADFIFSICGVPGLPQDEFKDAVTTAVTSMTDDEFSGLLQSLEDGGVWLDEGVTKQDVIKGVIDAERNLASGPRDMASFCLADRDYYISGLLSHGDGTDSMQDIAWLTSTGFENLGHDHG